MQTFRSTRVYLYDPDRSPSLILASKASSGPSGERRESGYAVTVAGIKCARRIIDALQWWEYYQQSSVNATCCKVKAEDICGGEFTFGDDVPEARAKEYAEIIERSQQSLVDAARDAETTGWGTLECLPLVGGGLHSFNHLPSHTCWAAKAGSSGKPEQVVHAFSASAAQSDATIYPVLGFATPREAQVAWMNNDHYPLNTYYGVPDSWPVLTQIEAVHKGVEWNREFFDKHGGYRWLLLLKSRDGQFDSTRDEKLLDLIEAHLKEVRGQNSDMLQIPIGGYEVEMHRLDADVKELDFGKMLEVFNADIQSAHRVPASVLGRTVTGALGGSVVQEEHDNYLKRVIKPKQRRWSQLINEAFKVYYGVNVGFKFGVDESIDLNKLAYPLNTLVKGQIIRINEARVLLGQEADPELENLYLRDIMETEELSGMLGVPDVANG